MARKKGKAPGRFYREGISLLDLFAMFPDEDAATTWFEMDRWGEGLYCPHCGSCSDRVSIVPSGKPMPFWCGDCRSYFSVRTGTVMERSQIPLQKWAIGLYLYVTNLKGVSSMKLHRDLDITQKSAWFMLHRIRLACQAATEPVTGPARTKAVLGQVEPMDGPIEVDETYIGGKEVNKHADKKLNVRGTYGKAIVAGIKDRKTKQVRVQVVQNADQQTLHDFIDQNARSGTWKYTDQSTIYKGLTNHQTCQHDIGHWVNGMAHTNGLESFWAFLKRGYHGCYHRMSVKHLPSYVAEFAARHNLRDKDTIDQMCHVFAGMIGRRLMYKDLVES